MMTAIRIKPAKTSILASVLVASVSLVAPAAAQGFQLAPYKDKLFAYPATLEENDNGNFLRVAFNKQRDVYGRDRIPLRKAHYRYVNENVRWKRRLRSYRSPNGTFKHYEVGKPKGAKVTVIYVHGKGGNRRQGVNDWTFGGNFNRLQNLMARNNGLLLTPDFSSFKDRGTTDIAALLSIYKQRSPRGKMVVACGSMGGGVCWRLAKNPDTASLLDGMFILGSHWHDDFLKSPTAKKGGRHIPIFFGHSTDDVVFSPKVQLGFYRRIKKQAPSYPLRFVLFDSGVHGTPIRMVDWRRELNWMLRINQ